MLFEDTKVLFYGKLDKHAGLGEIWNERDSFDSLAMQSICPLFLVFEI